MYYYNPLDKFCKSYTGAIPEDTQVTFSVKTDSSFCTLIYYKDGSSEKQYLSMSLRDGFYSITSKFERGLFWYYFQIDDGFLGLGEDLLATKTNNPQSFQLSVFKKDYTTPDFLKGGVIYQIFPDRFCRGEKHKSIEPNKILRSDWGGVPTYLPNEKGQVLNNDFFGGDLKGIISKLDYLQSLSVNVIYLNPIFRAYSNHRYDTGDYMQIDPLLGTKEDFIELIKQANARGIKIILDGVFNHVGDDSIYFNRYGNYDSVGAYQSKQSPYYKWFDFIDYPNEYHSWWGITTLPAVDKNNKDYINYVTGKDGVIETYTKLGIGGWRLDVVDELNSNFVKSLRNAVKRINPQATIIGEVWEDASNKIAYGQRREYFLGDELDSVMNYPLKNAILNFTMHNDCSVLRKVVNEQIDHYPSQVLTSLMNILSTHDTFRLLSAVSGLCYAGKTKSELSEMTIPNEDYEKAVFRLKLASLLQYTLIGVPSLYYGDEAGMQGFTDPLNRKCFPWDNQDLSITEWYKFLGKLRSDYSAFAGCGFEEIYAKGGVYIFKRFDDESEILVAINLSANEFGLEFDGQLIDLLSKNEYKNVTNLDSNSFGIFIAK